MIVIHGGLTGLVVGAGEAVNSASGGSGNDAVVIALIGVAGLILQMVVRDWLDERRSKRHHRPRRGTSANKVIEMQRKEIGRLTRLLAENGVDPDDDA